MNTRSSVVVHSTVAELVACYQESAAAIRSSFQRIQEAEDAMNRRFNLDGWSRIRVRCSYNGDSVRWDRTDPVLEVLRRDFWRVIVDRLELRRFMSHRRYSELEKTLTDGELPDITEENVTQFSMNLVDQIHEMINESVDEVFGMLRPPRSPYATNTEMEIGPRVILEHYVEPSFSGRCSFRVNYHYSHHLTCIENVFQALDGKGAINKFHKSELQNSIETTKGNRGSTTYFEWKAFRKGTLHLRFLRPDLLDKLNRIAGGKRLRPGEAA